MPDIAAINLTRREVVMNDGDVLPITNLYDEDFMPTTAEDEASIGVAGRGGYWVTFAVRDFTPQGQHQ